MKTILLLLTVILVSTACVVPSSPQLVRGSGDVITEEREVNGFEEIFVSGAGTFIITQGDSESLSIETDDNLMEYIETEVKGNILEIGFSDDIVLSEGKGRKVLEPSDGFVFRISVIDLRVISVSGAARFEIGKLKTDEFRIEFSGAGEINLDDLNARQLEVTVSGAGDIQLAGKVNTQDIILSGLGRYQAFDLESQDAAVTISGAGGAEVWATETLDVVISGAGDVKYFGSPTVNPEISGLGRIQNLGDK